MYVTKERKINDKCHRRHNENSWKEEEVDILGGTFGKGFRHRLVMIAGLEMLPFIQGFSSLVED